MSTALTVVHDSLPPIPLMELGNVLSQSGFFQDSKQASQAVVKVLAGRELGIGPVSSMTGINIIKGKVSLSANLMAGCIKRSGRYSYRVDKLDDKECRLTFLEAGQPIGESVFTLKDAVAAGLANGDNWKKFTRNMLFARAISNGAKWFCPDLFGGPAYTPDELGATVNEDGEAIDVPATATVVTTIDADRARQRAMPTSNADTVANSNGDAQAMMQEAFDGQSKPITRAQRNEIIILTEAVFGKGEPTKTAIAKAVEKRGKQRLDELTTVQAAVMVENLQRIVRDREVSRGGPPSQTSATSACGATEPTAAAPSGATQAASA